MKKKGIGGLLYLAIIGLALVLMGGAFMTFLWKSYASARATRTWPEIPAVIIVSQVGERKLGPYVPAEYHHELVYEYEIDGKLYQGDRLKHRENPFLKDKSTVEGEVERLNVGLKTTAWVNPENPKEVVLEHDSKAAGYSIWFPGIFVVGGLGVFFGAIRKFFKNDTL